MIFSGTRFPTLTLLFLLWAPCARSQRFDISFPPSAHQGPITGRVFIAIAPGDRPEPMLAVGSPRGAAMLYGADVEQLSPNTAAVIDARTPGYPVPSLKDIPPGDYFVEALVNVYSEFHRADGHTIWAHMDQWEGQQFNRSPGNLYSEVQRVHLDAGAGYEVKLQLTKMIPPVEMPTDTGFVKHVRIQSALLTKFWGRPIYLGATVLLPAGYAEHPDEKYPAIYHQFHFGLNAPFSFSEAPGAGRGGRGYQFYQQWTAAGYPRVIAVTFQHPTPFYDDSYAVNSANNGPYGDALTQELIPYLEEHFRMIRAPWARTLTGGSTGGWEALALQLFHPDLFGGAWVFCPDPIDFRKYQLVNIYSDTNAFEAPSGGASKPERPMMRTAEGQVTMTVRQGSSLEEVLGSRGRSGEQLNAWEAVYGPADSDGYPRPLWDKGNGKIDHEVADYMRSHNYDLSAYLKTNWETLEKPLQGKLHFYVGDMDGYYLNLAVYQVEDFLKTTKSDAKFEYGRPLKGHMWYPMTDAELVKMMAAEMEKHR